MNTLTFKPGDRIKPSAYAIRPKKDWWLQQGRSDLKSAAKRVVEAEIARRGVVLSSGPTKYTPEEVHYRWDDGQEGKCLSYMVELATD